MKPTPNHKTANNSNFAVEAVTKCQANQCFGLKFIAWYAPSERMTQPRLRPVSESHPWCRALLQLSRDW